MPRPTPLGAQKARCRGWLSLPEATRGDTRDPTEASGKCGGSLLWTRGSLHTAQEGDEAPRGFQATAEPWPLAGCAPSSTLCWPGLPSSGNRTENPRPHPPTAESLVHRGGRQAGMRGQVSCCKGPNRLPSHAGPPTDVLTGLRALAPKEDRKGPGRDRLPLCSETFPGNGWGRGQQGWDTERAHVGEQERGEQAPGHSARSHGLQERPGGDGHNLPTATEEPCDPGSSLSAGNYVSSALWK